VAAQTAVRTGSGDRGVDKLSGHHQQVIKRQQPGFAQRHDHNFPGRGKRDRQAVRGVRAISSAITAFPTADRTLTHAQLIGQLRDGLGGCLNGMTGLRGRIRMQVDVHGSSSITQEAMSSSIISLARNKGPILVPAQSSGT